MLICGSSIYPLNISFRIYAMHMHYVLYMHLSFAYVREDSV